MKIKKGTYRIAFVFKNFTVKIPRVWWKVGFKNFLFELKRKRLFIEYLGNTYNPISSKTHWFGGIICNWQERSFYRQTKLPILTPTYFSFFGLFNIQKTGQPIKMSSTDLWCQLGQITNGKVYDDGHAFKNPENFSVHNGKLQILDYPKTTHDVLMMYGDKIHQVFDFSYKWEDEKKKLKS